MTYPQLLSAIYARYDNLLASWDAEMEQADNVGVFAFLPEGYAHRKTLDESEYSFMTIDDVKKYLKVGKQNDLGFLDLLNDFNYGEEFLVMIVERDELNDRNAIHIHKITRVGLN
jgi:hypothetical protein